MGKKNSSNRRLELASCSSANVMPGHEREMTFRGSVSNYLVERLAGEPTGAKAVLSFVEGL